MASAFSLLFQIFGPYGAAVLRVDFFGIEEMNRLKQTVEPS